MADHLKMIASAASFAELSFAIFKSKNHLSFSITKLFSNPASSPATLIH
jgi:hypothetical protein